MKKVSSILWGIILIAAGLLFAVNALDIVNVDIFFDGWWTLLIIVPCAVGIFTERDKTGNIIGLLIGIMLLLCCRDVISFGMMFKLIVPIIIVCIGVKKLIDGISNGKTSKQINELKDNGNLKNAYAFFSGSNMNFNGEIFEGAKITAVFGGVECDLRNAVIEKDCVVSVVAVFGGADILVPQNVNVKINSTALFGGVDDKTIRSKDNSVTLYINATCAFGGVDVK